MDCGQVKELRYHPNGGSSGLSSLETVWCSQAAAVQRSGRAGRTRPGHCWRMFPKDWWGEMAEEEEHGNRAEEEEAGAGKGADSSSSFSSSEVRKNNGDGSGSGGGGGGHGGSGSSSSSSSSSQHKVPLLLHHSSPLPPPLPPVLTLHAVPEMRRTALEDLVLQVIHVEFTKC